jgi:tetratricopeptide (TPR) repeat protein
MSIETIVAIKNQIAGGQLESPIRDLNDFLREKNHPLLDEALALGAQWTQVEKEHALNTIAYEAYARIINNITYGLLRLCTQVIQGAKKQDSILPDPQTLSISPQLTGQESDWVLKGKNAYAADDYAGAIAAFAAAVAENPGGAEALFYQGVIQEELGDTDTAISSYQKSIAANPAYAQPYNNLGVIFVQEEHWEEALQCLNKTLQIDPDMAVALLNRGFVYYSLEFYPESLADLQSCARKGHYLQETFNLIGLIKINQGDFAGAIENSQRALKIHPDNHIAFYLWGLAAFNLEHYREAVEKIDQSIALNPNYPGSLSLRGMSYALLGDYPKALVDIETALETSPEDANLYFWMGYVKKNQGDPAAAVHAYRLAVEYDPEHKSSLVNLAQICMESNLYQEALGYLNQAKEIDPHWEVIHTLLSEVEKKTKGGFWGKLFS